MKKTLALMLIAVLCLSLCACGKAGVDVNVTVSDAGSLVVTHKTVSVPDDDGDGEVSVDATIAAVHDAFYEGGAKAGYASEESEYGITIQKLWGVENGGSYGYYLNDAFILPGDTIKAGDDLFVYSYADLTGWTDVYTYFDKHTASVAVGGELKLQLTALVYDENWNLVAQPFGGAAVTVNGAPVEAVTAEDGSAAVSFDKAGEYVVSVSSADTVLVPAICVVTVK